MGKRVTNKHFRDPTAEAVFRKDGRWGETESERNRNSNNWMVFVFKSGTEVTR